VAFPTETVYGIAANADLPEAVKRLRRIKGRSPDKPFQILVAGSADAARFWGEAFPPEAQRLMDKLWPGPLTIVVAAADGRSCGFRCPAHPVALDLIKAAGVPVCATSANPSGMPDSKTADDVERYLGDEVDIILDAGECKHGKPSTVVRISGGDIEILREGALSEDELKQVLEEMK